MNIFKEAKQNKLLGKSYYARRMFVVWKNKNVPWNWLAFEYGIRRSNKLQIFPIWNASTNGARSLIFGFWKFYIQVIWHRKNGFNQNRKLFLQRRLRKFYQLVS